MGFWVVALGLQIQLTYGHAVYPLAYSIVSANSLASALLVSPLETPLPPVSHTHTHMQCDDLGCAHHDYPAFAAGTDGLGHRLRVRCHDLPPTQAVPDCCSCTFVLVCCCLFVTLHFWVIVVFTGCSRISIASDVCTTCWGLT